jgi:stage II sporulation protein D
VRRAFPLIALVGILLAFAPGASGGTLFVLTGAGWGHGVGMSQWGAYGLAKDGAGYVQILKHYYAGTSVEERPAQIVRVQLASGRTAVEIGSDGAFRVSATSRNVLHAAGAATVTKSPEGRIKVEGITGTFASPATFTAETPTTAPLRLGSAHYRGTLIVSVVGGRLRVVNRLPLDLYVRGVVPNESPASWPAAALRAQAVAARSYAFYGWFHGQGGCGDAFCPDTSDQVYRGLDSEQASTNDAVVDTARQVVVDGADNVAQAFFSSSNGGRSAAAVDVWGGNVSYLQSVADPKDLNPDNPNRFWRVLRTPLQLRNQLDLPGPPNDGTVTLDGSARVARMNMAGRTWSVAVEYTDDSFRGRLDVKSTKFRLGVLRLTTSDGRIEWGQQITLSALARGIANATLERRAFGGAWQDVEAVTGAEDFVVSPRVTTWFRLGTPSVTGVIIRIGVEPRLRIDRVGATFLAGFMRPRLAGTRVTVKKLVSGVWKAKAFATLRADGRWRANFAVTPGRYRADAAPGDGYLPGSSPQIVVGA